MSQKATNLDVLRSNGISVPRGFVLDDAQWQAFTAALEAPAKPRPRLEALLREPGVFD